MVESLRARCVTCESTVPAPCTSGYPSPPSSLLNRKLYLQSVLRQRRRGSGGGSEDVMARYLAKSIGTNVGRRWTRSRGSLRPATASNSH